MDITLYIYKWFKREDCDIMEGMNIFKWHTFLPNIGDTFPQFGWFVFHRRTLAAANQRRVSASWNHQEGTHNLGVSQTSVPFRHNDGLYLWIVWWSFRLHLLHSYGNLGGFPWFSHSSPWKDPGFCFKDFGTQKLAQLATPKWWPARTRFLKCRAGPLPP